ARLLPRARSALAGEVAVAALAMRRPEGANKNRNFPLAEASQLRQRQHMNDLALSLRQARPSDAADLARIYVESWQDTYAGILPHSLLSAMSVKTHTIRWQNQL